VAEFFEGFRTMPHNLEAEQSVLGAILVDANCINEVEVILKSEDFYDHQNRDIYEACSRMFAESRSIDFVTLLEQLKLDGVFDDLGGKRYLMQLVDIVPTTANVGVYATIVREKAILRSLIEACREISQACYEQIDEARTILENAEQRVYDIVGGRENRSFTHVREVLILTYQRLQLLAQGKGKDLLGTPTGFYDLDKVLIGMGNSDLILIAARPGMGKTSFALNIAQHAAIELGKKVAIFSLEMSKEQLAIRLLSSEAEIDSNKLRTGELNESDWARISRASSKMSSSDILIDDSTGITPTEMKAKLRRVQNLGLVIIDYLQLMQSPRKSDNRTNEVADITRGLKILAKDIGVPVITLSQLSRGTENRPGRRPILADLRDSGAIEQDADVVIFLFREEYYDQETDKHGIAECIIAKNRHGETRTVELGWVGEYTKFTNMEHYRDEP
jgi:replicative DNA helicase